MASLKQLLETNADRYPDKPFIIEPETKREITFAEFQAEVANFAETLRQNGFVSGKKGLIIMNNGIQFATAFFAIISLGGTAVPVNPVSKESELRYLIEDSKSSYIITNDDSKSIAEVFGKSLIVAANGNTIYRIERQDTENSDSTTHIALFMYTSGTTGKPKGVMLTEENLIAEASFIKMGHELTDEDMVLCELPYFHINGLVVTLITPTYCGITIILPKKFSASAFWGLISQYKPKWVNAVPTIYSIVLNKSTDGIDLSSLKFARSATSALPIALLDAFEQKTGVPIIEAYGISEGGSQITSNPRPPKKRKAGSVGFPYGTEIKIVDDAGALLPTGHTGEVKVRGANISSGYYGKPEETAASFIDGWFHTGDLGHFDEEGYLFLTGRKKELINRAGEKISPKEIDEVLYRLPQIELAAAVGVPHELYGEEVIAYIKLRDGYKLNEADIKEHCAKELADYKIPKEIYSINDFPKGPSGKIQRLKLVDIYKNSISPIPGRLT